jgi:(p)ppGpp synthase/HD superfamily hydrolase
MKTWDQEKYIKAFKFACHAHNGQLVPGSDLPYVNHVANVAMEVMAAIAHNKDINSPDLLVQCALLHDVLEDTKHKYDEIETEFGIEVAEGVSALSKSKLLSKKFQMDDSIKRIKKQPKEVWMVKLADRITNLQPPPKHWNKEKIKKYQDEAIVILDKLGDANQYLKKRMENKIEEYGQYV